MGPRRVTLERARPWLIGLAIVVVIAMVVLLALAWINMASDLNDLSMAGKHLGKD